MRWAGSPSNLVNDCLAAARVVNQSFDIPLPDAEEAATARSVHKYRASWITTKGKYFTWVASANSHADRQSVGVWLTPHRVFHELHRG